MQINLSGETNPFGNNANIVPNPHTSSDTNETELQNRLMCFAVYGGHRSRLINDLLFTMAVVCDITAMAEFKTAPINEKESKEMGKYTYKSNSGLMHTSSWTINGDAGSILAVLGYDMGEQLDTNYGAITPSAMSIMGDEGIRGIGLIYSGGKSKHLRSSEICTQVRLKITGTAGATASYTVELESEGEHFKSYNGSMFVVENFVDDGDGLIENPFAPDGIRTTFKVGDGNQSLLGTVLPNGDGLPLSPIRVRHLPKNVVFSDVTDPYVWFVEVALNGTTLPPSELLSFDLESGVLELTNAPAYGSCLTISYLLPTGYPTFNKNVKHYVGEVRMYMGSYYSCNTNTTLGEEFDAGQWDLLTEAVHRIGAKYRPHCFGQGNPDYPTCLYNSWTKRSLKQ